MQYAAYAAISSIMQHVRPHLLAKCFEAKLIRFGQIWLKFGQIWSDLCKIKNLASSKNSISYGYMPKCLLFLVSIAGTTGMNMSTENNMLHLLC